MRLLIVNGDDFGLARGVNEGIIDAHRSGILTSTSLMVLRAAASEAAKLARANPGMSVGLHFEEDGSADLDDPAEVKWAFLAQLERFRELMGQDPTHVDSHHHVHRRADRMATFKALVGPLEIPLRHDGHVAFIDGFWGQPDPACVSRSWLCQLVGAQAGEGFSELGCHPARISDDLHSSYRAERAIELSTLTEADLREELEAGGVSLVSYHAWPT